MFKSSPQTLNWKAKTEKGKQKLCNRCLTLPLMTKLKLRALSLKATNSEINFCLLIYNPKHWPTA